MTGRDEEQARRRREALEETRLGDYAAGQLDPAADRELEAQLIDDADLAEELYADLNLEAVLRGAAKGAAKYPPPLVVPRPWWRRARLEILGPLAVAAAVVVLVGLPVPDEPPTFRGDTGVVRGLSPRGAQSSPPHAFVWTRDAGAERYRLELFGTDTRLVFSTTTPETTFALAPGTVATQAIERGFWIVTALDTGGRERSKSTPVEFETTIE